MVFQCINIRQVPFEVLKTAAFGLGFQHLPRDLVNVYAWKTLFDPYIMAFLSRRNNLYPLFIKGSRFLTNKHFYPRKVNKLIYSINTIIKCGIWQPVKFQLVFRFLTGSKIEWFFIVSLNKCWQNWFRGMIKNHFISRKRLTEILQADRCHILWLY